MACASAYRYAPLPTTEYGALWRTVFLYATATLRQSVPMQRPGKRSAREKIQPADGIVVVAQDCVRRGDMEPEIRHHEIQRLFLAVEFKHGIRKLQDDLASFAAINLIAGKRTDIGNGFCDAFPPIGQRALVLFVLQRSDTGQALDAVLAVSEAICTWRTRSIMSARNKSEGRATPLTMI